MKTVAEDLATKWSEVIKRGSDHSKQHPNKKAINMVFTKYNDNIVFDPDTMDYLAFGNEVCPSTGRRHQQGFICWKNARSTYACMKKYECFMAPMKGSLIQNDDYCSKEGALIEFGRRPKQGERTDLTRAVNEVIEGRSVDDIALNQPMLYHTYGRTLTKVEDIAQRSRVRTTMTEGYWYVGKTGKGKSAKAFADFSVNSVYVYPYDGGWWDGYHQQDTVIFDEFRGQIPFNELLRIIDRWPNYNCRRRNREPMPFNSKRVIITSALRPEQVYHNIDKDDNIDQLMRRLQVYNL